MGEMTTPIRLMLINEHRFYRDCLRAQLAGEATFAVVAEASTFETAAAGLAAEPVDVVLMDGELEAPGPAAWTRRLRADHPAVKILVFAEEDTAVGCLEAGAAGCLSRQASLVELKQSLLALGNGEIHCPPHLLRRAMRRLGELGDRLRSSAAQRRVLSEREIEILQLVAAGLANKEIAQRLYLSLHTVKNHVHNILDKLEVGGRYAAVVHAHKQGWLEESWH